MELPQLDKSNKYQINIVNSFAWALLDRGGMLVFQFIALIILSRLLTPYDFGIIGILMIFMNLSAMLIDSGMTGALIGKKEVSNIDYSTLFIFNLVLSLFLYTILYLISPLVSSFYSIPELTYIIRILSLSIIFNAVGVIQFIKLTRAYRYKILAIITLTSQIFSVMIAIYMAKKGAGVLSLVALQVIPSFFNTLLLMGVNKYIPNIQFSKKSFKEQFNFGMPLLFSNILYVINNNIINSLIGKLFTPIQTGYYTQSSKLQNIPSGILDTVLDKVGFTILSKEADISNMKMLSIKMNKYIYLIVFPIFFFIIMNSKTIFLFVLGEKWIDATWIFAILSYALIPITIKIVGRNIIKSCGKTKLILRMEIVNTFIGIAILSITASISIKAIIIGILITSILVAITCLYYVSKALHYPIKEQLSAFIIPLVISLVGLILKNLILYKYNLYGFSEIWISGLVFFSIILLIYFKTKVITFNNAIK